MKTTPLSTNCIQRSLSRSALLFFSLVVGCFAILPMAQAVSPPPDGGYPGFTTAEGDAALNALSGGLANTAVGWFSLSHATTASFNTAIGAGALDLNTADENTATGAAALLSNTTGGFNTANGTFALAYNSTGQDNTALGDRALQNNTTGNGNTATGSGALLSNSSGMENTAIGTDALLLNTTGSNNIALGSVAGKSVTTASNVICIGSGIVGANVDNSCYIGNIRGQLAGFNTLPVLINSDGKLGTMQSSRRFKHDIKPMDRASEAILALKPVTFHYNGDNTNKPECGLIAEDVEKMNPDLVVRDKEGKPYSVRYDQVNAMLLNEFLKEHCKVERQERKLAQQETTIAQLKSAVRKQEATAVEQRKEIAALTAGLQKVNAQIEARPALQVVNNNQ